MNIRSLLIKVFAFDLHVQLRNAGRLYRGVRVQVYCLLNSIFFFEKTIVNLTVHVSHFTTTALLAFRAWGHYMVCSASLAASHTQAQDG